MPSTVVAALGAVAGIKQAKEAKAAREAQDRATADAAAEQKRLKEEAAAEADAQDAAAANAASRARAKEGGSSLSTGSTLTGTQTTAAPTGLGFLSPISANTNNPTVLGQAPASIGGGKSLLGQ